MSTATAILFPGQGSQTDDMRDWVAQHCPDLLEAAVQAVGEDPFPRAAEGTNFAQPAIFCASLAGWAALDERDGLELVALRGRLMHEAGVQAGDGSMVAVLGAGAAERAPEIAGAHGLVVANDNSPQQVVLSGPKAELPQAIEHAKELGLRATELDVTGAFHSPMMESAVPEFTAALQRTRFDEPRVPVISAVTVQPFSDPRQELADALTNPVRWRETMLALHELGAERFVEVGPGRVLTGLVKRTLSDVELLSA